MFTSLIQRAVRKIQKDGFKSVFIIAKRSIAPFFSGMFIKKKDGAILYVIGCSIGESKRYRVYNLIDALTPYGLAAQVIYQESLPYLRPKGYKMVVFFRCKTSAFTLRFMKKCKRSSIPAVYDVDDLVFDYAIVDKVREEDALTDRQYRVYIKETDRYCAMIKECDYATGSTVYLCEYMQNRFGKQAFLIPNGLNQKQIDTALNLPEKESSGMQIGFLSGSNTHNKDFEQAEQALASLLAKYSELKLVIVGYLDVSARFSSFGDRVEHIPFMDYLSLMRFCSRFYAVIVPLEVDTLFCNAKSELKYFEQALIGVPVVASPTEPYKACITDGVNGLLAEGPQQWEGALERLIQDRTFRDTLAETARLHIQDRYYPDIIGETANAVYSQILKSAVEGG